MKKTIILCSFFFCGIIFSQTENKIKINHILSKDFLTKAKRPLNSRLDCTSLEKDYGIKQPDWRKSLSTVLEDLK